MSVAAKRRNRHTGLLLSVLVAGMVGLSFAAVPLYRLFCQVTGYGGTPRIAAAAPAEASKRLIKVRFNADVQSALPWRFRPVEREIEARVGEPTLAVYQARNLAGSATVGSATFNVTPLKAGPYFSKVQCFCFTEQRLEAGEAVDMTVSFFVDPAIEEDRNLDEVRTITLSYSFFAHPEAESVAARTPAGSGSPN
jgi:cytochrome c oxidase assembly protein subunit 11